MRFDHSEVRGVGILSLFVTTFVTAGLILAQESSLVPASLNRIAFVKAGQVYIAREDGTKMLRISPGEDVNAMPRWSSDGKRVLYFDTKVAPNSLGTLVVVDTKGAILNTLSILTATPDGIQIGGMRFVEQIGWVDKTHVFAAGSVNPYAAEYRIFDLASGKVVGGFGGTNFATCPAKGVVAFWLPVFPPSTAMILRTSTREKPVLTFPDRNALPETNIELAWDKRCEFVAFIDPRRPSHLSLATQDGVRRRIPISDGLGTSLIWAQGGVILGSSRALFYDFEKSQVEPTPPETLSKLRQRDLSRQRTAEHLGTTDADWWVGSGN